MKVGLLVMKNLVESGSMESPPPLAIPKRNIEKRERERERERERKEKEKDEAVKFEVLFNRCNGLGNYKGLDFGLRPKMCVLCREVIL